MKGVLFGFIGLFAGGFVGWIVGFAGPLVLVYLIAMVRNGPWSGTDRGTIEFLVTGPIGALIGAILGARIGLRYSRRS
jgi:hypothetical protein